MSAILLLSFFILALSACSSPETSRSRGSGAGADVGNRSQKSSVVRMHEGSDPYAKTPKIIRAQGTSLAGARQAERLSRQ